VRITGATTLSEEEIERMKREAQEHAEEDRRRKRLVELRNQADTLLYTTEKELREVQEKLTPELKAAVENAAEHLKSVMKEDDIQKIEQAISQLNEAWNKASKYLYEQAEAGKATATQAEGGATTTDTSGKGGGEGGVEEADYTIVDDDK